MTNRTPVQCKQQNQIRENVTKKKEEKKAWNKGNEAGIHHFLGGWLTLHEPLISLSAGRSRVPVSKCIPCALFKAAISSN